MNSSINVHFIHNSRLNTFLRRYLDLKQVPCKYFSDMQTFVQCTIANFNLTNVSLKYDLDFAYSFELVCCNKLHDYILIEIIMRV